MRELSIFVDESGSQGGHSKYCMVTLLFHDQNDSIDGLIADYEGDLKRRELPPVPFHASPLMNGHESYGSMDMATRKRLLSSFEAFTRRLPFTYATFSYRRKEVPRAEDFTARFRRDLVVYLTDHLDYFQRFDRVKIYYDNAQQMVTESLHKAIDYVLSKQAVLYRLASARDYRLSQVADYLCTLELTELKYVAKELTPTDVKVFGEDHRAFVKNHLKKARRKMLK